MVMTTIVARIHAAGFLVGPDTDDPCGQCGHVWGNHVLVASNSGDPIDGGHAQCPYQDCECLQFWDLPEEGKEKLRELRARGQG